MSLGKDLASIRKEQGLSLDEIQHSIKIPILTLKSIESESIFESSEHNQTYIRSFIRSYAKALKINDETAVKALDAFESGTYESSILLGSDATKTETPSVIPPATVDDDSEEESFDLADVEPPKIEHATPKPKPEVENVNWADMGRKFTLQESGSKVWIIALVVIFILALGGTGFYFRAEIAELFDSTSGAEQQENTSGFAENNVPANTPETPAAEDNTISAPTQEFQEPAEQEVITQSMTTLGDTLTVAVYAAYDRLEPVRVTSDLNWRTNPFWMEQGEAFYFDFQDTLLIRGQYTRMMLLFNGHIIERPRQLYYSPEYSSIMLTRDIFNSDQYMTPASADEFPLEVGAPDSIVYRLQY